MNFLQLVNRARSESGVSGGDLTTLTGLTTLESKRFYNWVQQAWIEIQAAREDWIFLRKNLQFTCTALTGDYDPTVSPMSLADFANFKVDSFRCSTVGSSLFDEQIMNFQPWDRYRDLYLFGPMRTNYMRPVVLSVTPAKHLALGAIPDVPYVITGEYFAQPITLSADTDAPAIPNRFHMLIVYDAMLQYAAFESAPEVEARAQKGRNKLWAELLREQTPVLVSGPPLA
jgi:hypothetical protein